MKEISLAELKSAVKNTTLIIDARPTKQFVDGYIQGAVNIVMNQNFVGRANYFSKEINEIILIAQAADKEVIESIDDEKLTAKISGVHYGNFENWQNENIPLDLIISVDAYELKLDITHDNKAIVLDVRTNVDYEEEHIAGAVNMQMNDFADPAKIEILDENSNLYLHCNSGTRSVLIASILKRNGYHNIRNIEGGYKAIKEDDNIPLHSNNKKSQN